MQISAPEKGSSEKSLLTLNSFESWKAFKNQISTAKAVEIQFIESLILAQDERWRRA